MPDISCIDDRGHLWQVKNLVGADELNDIVNICWDKLPNESMGVPAFLKRKVISPFLDDARRAGSYITKQLDSINKSLNTNFQECNGNFWMDLPGFTVDMHTDGHLTNVMQMYWIVPGPEFGTGFYFYKNKKYLQYQFQSFPNTGYIMLNHMGNDGYQPLHWHGMFNPVPPGCIRLSSYWYFC